MCHLWVLLWLWLYLLGVKFFSCPFVWLIIFGWQLNVLRRPVEAEVNSFYAWKWTYISFARLLIWGEELNESHWGVGQCWASLLLWLSSGHRGPWIPGGITRVQVGEWGGVARMKSAGSPAFRLHLRVAACSYTFPCPSPIGICFTLNLQRVTLVAGGGTRRTFWLIF